MVVVPLGGYGLLGWLWIPRVAMVPLGGYSFLWVAMIPLGGYSSLGWLWIPRVAMIPLGGYGSLGWPGQFWDPSHSRNFDKHACFYDCCRIHFAKASDKECLPPQLKCFG